MAVNLGVAFFIPFHELDPHQQSQCIFFTQKKKRCSWSCQEQDNSNARELYDHIKELPSTELPSLEQLENYARYNCCGPKPKGARHQDRIEDIELLAPLAERWLDEIIQRREAEQAIADRSAPATDDKQRIGLASPSPSASPVSSPSATIHHLEPSKFTATATGSIPSPPSSSRDSEEPSISVEHGSESGEPVSRYALRRRQVGENTKIGMTSSRSVPRAPLSVFRPHVEEPSENVLSKLLAPLVKDDFKTGSLYIFDRASSPGYVKIGWTSRSVQSRLDSWSKCGYTPNLLFTVDDIPYANRAETLTHYELVAEWRAERSCKVCGKSHREWFEVSQEKATQIVSDWASFLKLAKPYEASGSIQSGWRKALDEMHKMNASITSSALMEYYRTSLKAKDVPKESVAVDNVLHVEPLAGEVLSTPGTNQGEVNSLGVKQPLLMADNPSEARPTFKSDKSLKFKPQLSSPKSPLPTPPLQLSDRFPESFPDSDSVIEPESSDKVPNPGLAPSPAFELGSKFFYQAPSAKTSMSEKSPAFDFSYITPPAEKPALGADTEPRFSFKTSPVNKSPLRKERNFDFSYQTPPAEQSDFTTGRKFDFSFLKSGATQTTSGQDAAFQFMPSISVAEQSGLEMSTKSNFAFGVPPTTQPAPATVAPGKVAMFDLAFRPALPTPSSSKTEAKFNFSFGRSPTTQFASGTEKAFSFGSQTPPLEQSSLGINQSSNFSFEIPAVNQTASRADTTFNFGSQSSATKQSIFGMNKTSEFSFKTPQANQYDSGPPSTFDFSFKAPAAR